MSRHTSAHTAPRANGRKTKAIFATAAGVALLAGGGASFAAWQASVLEEGTIQAGHLTLESTGGKWTLNDGTSTTDEAPVIVPGDTLVYTDTILLSAAGTDIDASLRTTLGHVTGTLGDDLDVTFKVGTVTYNGWNDVVMPITGPTTEDIDVEVTIDFPFGAVPDPADAKAGQAGQNESLKFEGTGLVLVQELTD